jgi:5-methylcytosine-specific restriction endonuclease McrA
MNWRIKDRITDSDFIRVCAESKSMAEAASTLGLHFNSFKKRALQLGCYKTNQSGIGFPKSFKEKVSLQEILQGKHPYFQTYKLKIRLLKSNMLVNQCAMCGINDWNGKSINLELDHIDGNRQNHTLRNLRLLCPNCHSQTDTYRAKNKSKKI